jgi:acylphosphatase
VLEHDVPIGRRLKIVGKVQGVFYRVSLQEEAERLGVWGWCRNLRTGEVQAEIWGHEDHLDRLMYWVHQGSPGSSVELVLSEDIQGELPPDKEHGFDVRDDA